MTTAAVAAVAAVMSSAPAAQEGRDFYSGQVDEIFAAQRIARIVG